MAVEAFTSRVGQGQHEHFPGVEQDMSEAHAHDYGTAVANMTAAT